VCTCPRELSLHTGPPHNKISILSGFLATLATAIGGSLINGSARAIPQFARRLTKMQRGGSAAAFIQFNVRRPHGLHSERRPSYPSVTSRAWLGWEKRDISHSLRNVAQCGALSVRQHQTPNYESDAVDGSSTGTSVPWMWVLLKLPRFGGGKYANDHDSRSRYR